jgi:uncharacterized protein
VELSLERPEDFLFVRRVEHDAVTVVDRRFTQSFVLARDHVIENWPPTDTSSLDPQAVEPILALDPEVVLLGTGIRQAFPSAEVQAAFLRKGVGIEVMDNAAAARTHAVLASEGRNVVVAFLLPGN